MAGLLSKQLFAFLGLIPFLSADFAIAFSVAQIPIPEQPSLQGDALCSSANFEENFASALAGARERLSEVATILSECNPNELGGIDRLIDIPSSYLRSGNRDQQLIALYFLRQMIAKVIDPDLSTELIAELEEPIAHLIALLEENALDLTVSAVAAETIGALTVRTIEVTAEQETSVETGLEISAGMGALLAVSESGDAQMQIAALSALRDIGQALQRRGVESEQAWTNQILTVMEAHLDSPSSSQESDSTAQQRQLIDVQVARVEALSAFLFVTSTEPESTIDPVLEDTEFDRSSNDDGHNSLCWPKMASDASDAEKREAEASVIALAEVNRGLQLLTCLAADTDGIETLVRAAAVTELERLGAIPSYRRHVASQLRLIGLHNLNTSVRIGAVETMSRIEAFPNPSPWPAWDASSEELPSLTESVQAVGDNLDLLKDLLVEGLESPATGNANDLRQRAEIAFDQLYDNNLIHLIYAISYAGELGETAVQRNAVQALGAVNYRRLSEPSRSNAVTPAYRETIARFLGQSLLCATDSEVRRDAAFALGQLAPYYPELFDVSLEPYWYKLLPSVPPESFEKTLVEICSMAAEPDYDRASQEEATESELKQVPKVIDALMLRLNDREENIVVAAAYTLSRYGIALDSTLKETAFLNPPTNESEEAALHSSSPDEGVEEDLHRLKACMKALISPTRFEQWPEEASDEPMYQPLVTLTEEYAATCRQDSLTAPEQYLLPEQGSNESAIAAAYILGQLGISDGLTEVSSEASEEERETVDFLLRALRGRDIMMTQREFSFPGEPRRPFQEPSRPSEYAYREDSVRDSIVSYVLSQIHPREHGLVQQLVEAITFPDKQEQPDDLPEEFVFPELFVERALSCEDPTRDKEDLAIMPVCIDDPITRASIVGAIEYVGISTTNSADSPQIAQRGRVQAYTRRLRQLMTQDLDPEIAEAMVTTVVERVMSLSALIDEPEANSTVAVEEAALLSNPDVFGSLSEQGNFDVVTKTEAAITSADTQTEHRESDADEIFLISENLAGTQYTLSFPFTSLYSCSGAAYSLARLGVYDDKTIDMLLHYLYVYPEPLHQPDPNVSEFIGNQCIPQMPSSDEVPSNFEQLVIFKTGAIAALGAISMDDPDSVRQGDQALTASTILPGTTRDVDQNRIEAVVDCLVDIANLEVFAPDAVLAPGEVLSTDLVGTSYLCRRSSSDNSSNSNEVSFERPDLTLRESEAFGRLGLSDTEIAQAKKAELTISEVEAGRRQGILVPEIIQANKWGLTPQEFYALKLRLQEPAIAAIGQLAQSEASDYALRSLLLAPLECSTSSRRFAASCQGLITSRSQRNLRGLPFRRLQTLKLELLKAVLLRFQGSEDVNHRAKVNLIVNDLLTNLATDNLDDFLKLDRENEEDNGFRRELLETLARDNTAAPLAAERSTVQAFVEQVEDYNKDFRNEVLKILVSLDRETIWALEQDTLTSMVEMLDVSSSSNALAQECLSEEQSLLSQERLCHGVTTLLSAALSAPDAAIPQSDVAAGTDYLQALTIDPDTDVDDSNDQIARRISPRFEVTRSSPIIRSSAIESLGELEASYTSSQDILLVRLRDDSEEPGVVENVINTYIRSGPAAGIPQLERQLRRDDPEDRKAAAYLISRIGQLAYSDTASQNSLSIEQVANAQDNYYEGLRAQWREALDSSDLVIALVNIVEDPESGSDLKANAINALGGIRSDNDAVNRLLLAILNGDNEDVAPEVRIAAAYALGNIGSRHAAVGGDVLPELYAVITNEAESSEARIVAAYALSQIGIRNYDSPVEINRYAIAYHLIELFVDSTSSTTDKASGIISPDAQKAIILYTLGQLEVNDDRVAQAYANGLHPGNPLSVRVVAATYARNLPLWNEALANGLLDALRDPNIAVRYSVIESIRQRQSCVLRELDVRPRESTETSTGESRLRQACVSTVSTDAAIAVNNSQESEAVDDSNQISTYEKLFVATLAEVFWDEGEYGFIRLAAAQALDDVLGSPIEKETFEETLEELGIDPNSQHFADIFIALENIEEFSADFRTPNSVYRGNDAIIQALRSSSLISEFDTNNINIQILFEILYAIRTEPSSIREQARERSANRERQAWWCAIVRCQAPTAQN